jgi:hypothetical protein
MMPLVSLKHGEQTHGVLAIHHVYDKDHIGARQIALDLLPFAARQCQPEVISTDAQLKIVSTIDLSLRLPERREKT